MRSLPDEGRWHAVPEGLEEYGNPSVSRMLDSSPHRGAYKSNSGMAYGPCRY